MQCKVIHTLTGSESPCGGVRIVEDDCEDDSNRQTDKHPYYCEHIATLELSVCRRTHCQQIGLGDVDFTLV